VARTDSLWETLNGGTAIQTIDPAGYDILINGTSKYLNFNSVVGSSGYGFRDNAGVMEVKNNGGSWAPFGGTSIGGTITGGTANSILFVNPTATLAQSLDFTYNDTSKILAVGGNGASGQILIGATASSATTDKLLITAASGQPNGVIQITGTAATSGSWIIRDNTTASNNVLLRLAPAGASSSTLLNIPLTGTLVTGGGASGGLYIGTNSASAPIVFFTGGSTVGTNERIWISSAGNVGFGSSPSSTLNYNISLGIRNDWTVGVERNTVSNTAGKSFTISSGGATVGATDKSSTLALATGITTGGAIGKINFNTAGIQTATPGSVLEVNLNDPITNATSGYTAGDVLTLVDTGSFTATVIIDSVDSFGIPITWHVGTAGTGYLYGDFNTATGGTGVNAFFVVTRVSGTADNAVANSGWADYLGVHGTGLYAGSNGINIGYPTINGGAYVDTLGANINGGIFQTDYNGYGFLNRLQSRTIVGSRNDWFGATLGGTMIVDSIGAFGLLVRNGYNTGYPNIASYNATDAQNFDTYPTGDTNILGNVNTANGGFGQIQNFLLQSEALSTASWTKTRTTVTDNFALAPNGTLTGTKIVANVTGSAKSVVQTTASVPAGTYTLSFYAQGVAHGDYLNVSMAGTGPGTVQVQMADLPYDAGASPATNKNWTRYQMSITTTGAGTITASILPLSGQTVYVADLMIQAGSSAGVYYKTTTTALSTASLAMYSNNDIKTQGNIVALGATSVIRLKGYTVATLPAGVAGDTAYVTDALAPTFLTAIVGGGAIVTPVFYNGANWVAH
jgi:hypothetical protein